MLGFGMMLPTWDPCCGKPRRGAPPLFTGGKERLVCETCGSWCNKPDGDAPNFPSTEPEWWKRMWAS